MRHSALRWTVMAAAPSMAALPAGRRTRTTVWANVLTPAYPTKATQGICFARIAGLAIKLIVVSCCIRGVAVCGAEPEASWQALPSLPVSNGGFAAGILNGQLVTIGGTTWSNGVKHWLGEVRYFSIETRQWHQASPLSAPVAYAAYGSNDRGLYWLGGSDGENTSDVLWHATSASSIQLVAHTGRPVAYAGAAVDDEALYVVAGAQNASDLSTLNGQFLRVDLESGQVETLPDYPAGGVMLPAVVRCGDQIFVFGGASYDPVGRRVVNSADAYAYSIKQKTWRKLAPLPHARRGIVACRLDDETILLGGGYGSIADQSEEGFASDAMLYRVREDRYVPAADLPYAAMGQAFLNDQGMLYILGGEDRPGQRSSAFYQRPAVFR